jgi:hypothetical protein
VTNRVARADSHGVKPLPPSPFPTSTVIFGTIDAEGRLSLGRVDRVLGPGLMFAAAAATPKRLVVRFLDGPIPPAMWVPVPVITTRGRYPHLRLSGSALRQLLNRAALSYPVHVRVRISVESNQIVVERVR